MAKVEVKVPDIGDFKDVPVIEVLVKPGDVVKVDQSLITLESDKATMDVPSPVAGEVAEVVAKVGDKVSMGTLIARVESAEGETAQASNAPAKAAAPAAVTEKPAAAPAKAAPAKPAAPPSARRRPPRPRRSMSRSRILATSRTCRLPSLHQNFSTTGTSVKSPISGIVTLIGAALADEEAGALAGEASAGGAAPLAAAPLAEGADAGVAGFAAARKPARSPSPRTRPAR